MPDLSDPQRLALGRYWSEIYGGAAQGLSTSDLFDNIRQRASDLGLPSVGVGASVISTLRSYASNMVASANRLNAASPESILDGRLLATPPWARPDQARSTLPIYHVGIDHTIQDDQGNISTVRQTIVLTGTLPATVGELQALIQGEAALLASESPGTSSSSPHGTSLGVDNLSVTVV